MRRSIAPLRDFLHRESASGILLLGAALAGLSMVEYLFLCAQRFF
jgi:hypothetical protein